MVALRAAVVTTSLPLRVLASAARHIATRRHHVPAQEAPGHTAAAL